MSVIHKTSHPPTYEFFGYARSTGQQFGALAKQFWSHPAFRLVPGAGPALMAAWGQLAERSLSRMASKPEWDIETVRSNGRIFPVARQAVISKPFCDLVLFGAEGRPPMDRQILLIAPMSGHYPTLLRKTVKSLLPECDLFLTEWKNARDVPASDGKFDIEDFTLYLAEFIRTLGPRTHVIAVCQPAPLALAATADLARTEPSSQPASLTLIGGPVIPGAAPTEVTDFGEKVTQGQIEEFLLQRVGPGHRGEGRMVFPGFIQLASFMHMNAETHFAAFASQMIRIAEGLAEEGDRHNSFYDEYLAVMDMPAEFYVSTVNRLFKGGEIGRGAFSVEGRPIDLELISNTAVLTVEGGRDDISAPGQSSAALPLLTGIPKGMKAAHIEPNAGHYGIFAGKSWRNRILPAILDFVDSCISHSKAA